MDNQTPPRDDDPSDMTDFEKNTASEELQRLEQDSEVSDLNRISFERGHDKPDRQKAGLPAVARSEG